MLPIGVVLEWHLVRKPRQRDVRLGPAKLLQGGRCRVGLPGHSGGGGEHPVTADEIAPLANRFPREPHGILIVASIELRVGRDAVVKCGKRIAWTEPQRASRGEVCVLPAPAI